MSDLKALKGYLYELHSDPRFDALMKTILQQRPQIPEYDPVSDNTEIWKSRSAERRGFDIWVAYLQIDKERKE